MKNHKTQTLTHFPLVIEAECPYCGHIQKNSVETAPVIVYCDCEEGGCDRKYVIKLPMSLEIEVQSLGIEGE